LSAKSRIPMCAAVYDISDSGEGVFLSMEYIDGEDLRSLLRRIIVCGQSHADAILVRGVRPCDPPAGPRFPRRPARCCRGTANRAPQATQAASSSRSRKVPVSRPPVLSECRDRCRAGYRRDASRSQWFWSAPEPGSTFIIPSGPSTRRSGRPSGPAPERRPRRSPSAETGGLWALGNRSPTLVVPRCRLRGLAGGKGFRAFMGGCFRAVKFWEAMIRRNAGSRRLSASLQ